MNARGADSDRIVESDPIDWVSKFWDAERLGDPSAMLAMVSIMRMHTLIFSAIEEALSEEGINLTDYLLLMTLELSEHRSRLPSRIAKAMMVHPTTVTLAVDRLEAAGLVERQRHPTDRRAVIATLTAAGIEKVRSATETLRGMEFGMPGVSKDDAREIIGRLQKARRAAGDVDVIPLKP